MPRQHPARRGNGEGCWYDGLHQVTRHDRGNLTPTGGPPFTGVDPITRAQQETFAFDQTGNWLAYTAQSPALG